MNRYFYYLLITIMLVNVLAFVPRILIRQRFDGAVMALPLSFLIGLLFIYLFTNALRKFPKQGFSEILDTIVPKWLKSGLLFYFGLVIYTEGMISMLAFADYTRQFLSPDIPMIFVTGLYLMLVIIVCRFSSLKILYILEILFLLSVPLTLFILFKAFLNKDMRWDDVFTVLAYYKKWPSWSDISAGTYIFRGFIYLAVFNRVLHPFKPKLLWLVSTVGLIISFTTLFIPIGFLGADAVGDYVFPWMSASDSMRIELGFIERVMYIFILFYGQIVFASLFFQWHVSLEMLKNAFSLPNRSQLVEKRITWCFLVFFFTITLMASNWVNDESLFYWGEMWLRIRLPNEALIVGLVVFAARRLKA